MSNKKPFSSLDLRDAVKAGWFQWYNIREYIEYPECHVLTYKLTDDCFYSQVLDFDIIASGETSIKSFENVGELALSFLKKYKERDGKIDFQPKSSQHWDKFRELYHKNKLQGFLSQNGIDNKNKFPFKYVHMAREYFKTLNAAMDIISIQEKTIKKQQKMMQTKQGDIEVLQAKVREMEGVGSPDRDKAELMEIEFY